MIKIRDKIAPLYATILPDTLLEIEIPLEKFTTCLECPNTTKPKLPRYHTKCCDYHPVVPNYMVGAILADQRPELAYGQAQIRQKIAAQVGVTPYAILQSADYARRFKESRDVKMMTQEQANDLLCPYNKENLCSIWDYRSELCATFHCMPSSGHKGSSFWQMMRSLLTTFENKLVLAVLDRLEYPAKRMEVNWRRPKAMDITRPDGTLDQARYATMWGESEGKEEAFYLKCFETLQAIQRPEVEHLLGIELEVFTKKTSVLAHESWDHQIPDRLTLDRQHPIWQKIVADGEFKYKERTIKVSPTQILLLKGFNGTTPTIRLVQESYLLRQVLTNMLSRLVASKVLKPS